ncbi:MAG: cellulase family glycosylhydrolase [Armatimonadetes bacterium]|nr:cellulase family glycosylhydrolase [Armatimonadota bacterium]
MNSLIRSIITVWALSALAPACLAAEDIVVWQRSAAETVLYDARPELGIGMHAFTPQQVAVLKPLGIRFVRLTLYWNQMEPGAEAQYAPDYLKSWDDHVRLAGEQGIELVAVVHAPPPGMDWAHKELAYERFARFMAAMAKRYPTVRYWELFNEMDGAFTDIFGANEKGVAMVERGKLYARMLKLAYPAIRAANPNAWVLTGGMTDFRDFPRGIYEGGGKEYFDILAIHTYGVPVTWSFIDRGRTVREVMRSYGDGDKPLWNTEFGIDGGNVIGAWGYPHADKPPRDDAQVLDQTQVDQWRECIEWNAKNRLYQKILPYQLAAGNERDDAEGKIKERIKLPAGRTIDDYGFGILRSDGKTPRPVYDWIARAQPNAAILARPKRKADVAFNPIFDALPAGASPVQWHSEAVIKAADVDARWPVRLPPAR